MGISSIPFSEDYPDFFSQNSGPVAISFSAANKRPKFDHSYDFEQLLTNYFAIDTPFEDFSTQQEPIIQEMKSEYYFNDSPPILAISGISSNNKRAWSEVNDVTKTPDESNTVAIGQRRLWVKNRSKAWWDQVNSRDCPEEEFVKAFRMSKATFDLICEELESAVTKKDTMLRLAIPVRQRVAVCIWRLATGEALREVSKRFGLGISTCHKLVLEVCTAITTVLMPKFLQWPDENRMGEIKREFEILSGISNVGGSMYNTHVPIIAPKVGVSSYFNKKHTERNQKTSYSVTVQGVVDPRGVFTDISLGWPGSMTDDQVLEKSAIFKRANRGALRDVWVVGNSGYTLLDWVLVPYTHQHLTWTQHAYNEKIEEVQSVVKEAFMRLKARWSCLQKRTEMKLQDLPIVLGACCVLHNICEMRNDELRSELRFELYDDEIIPENSVRSVVALHARDRIGHKLLHQNQAAYMVVIFQNPAFNTAAQLQSCGAISIETVPLIMTIGLHWVLRKLKALCWEKGCHF